MTDLDVTTVKHDASDARVATAAGRTLAELIDRERGKGAAADRRGCAPPRPARPNTTAGHATPTPR